MWYSNNTFKKLLFLTIQDSKLQVRQKLRYDKMKIINLWCITKFKFFRKNSMISFFSLLMKCFNYKYDYFYTRLVIQVLSFQWDQIYLFKFHRSWIIMWLMKENSSNFNKLHETFFENECFQVFIICGLTNGSNEDLRHKNYLRSFSYPWNQFQLFRWIRGQDNRWMNKEKLLVLRILCKNQWDRKLKFPLGLE